jgi:hypothetical protein
VHGSYRVFVSASVTDSDKDQTQFRSVTVYASSSALEQNKGELSGKITIEKEGTVLASAGFARQPPNSIVESPKSDETARIFLPVGKVLDVPRGAAVIIAVSLVLNTDSGSCSLGSTSNSHDLFK